ncbi:MAG: hypothetical protein WBP54_10595 [Pelodictyon phaeoclathratiforme]
MSHNNIIKMNIFSEISTFVQSTTGLIMSLILFVGSIFEAIRFYNKNHDIHEMVRNGVFVVIGILFLLGIIFGGSNYTEYVNKGIIREFIKAEDGRDFDKIIKYYSINLKKYYGVERPNIKYMNLVYTNNWKLSSNPTTIVHGIKSYGNNVYYVSVVHRSVNKKTSDLSEKERIIYIHLDDQGKIDEIDRPGAH